MSRNFHTEILLAKNMQELSIQLNELVRDGWIPRSVSVYDASHPETPAWYLVLVEENQ